MEEEKNGRNDQEHMEKNHYLMKKAGENIVMNLEKRKMNNIKIHALKCGMVMVDRALPYGNESGDLNSQQEVLMAIGGYRSQEYQVMLNVYSYLIEHPKGKILVDTGWHTDVRYNQYEVLGDFHYKINKAFLPKGQAIDEHLSVMEIKPKSLDYVLLTHLHTDHASGLKLVADAGKIMVSDVELKAALGPAKESYEQSMWKGVNLESFALEDTGIGPHGKSFDLFGDGSVEMISVAGHTPGLCACKVTNADGKFVLITGDCGYAKKSWEQMVMPGVMWNFELGMKSLKWVHDMALDPNCIEVLAMHDPELEPHVIEF